MECLICDRIDLIKKGQNPYFIKELSSGFVVLEDFQYYPGYALFMFKEHASELHELSNNRQQVFLNEMVVVAKAIWDAFSPIKLNYELLGNAHPHLHWHLIPRYPHDALLDKPIWQRDESERKNEANKPSPQVFKEMIEKLKLTLGGLDHA